MGRALGGAGLHAGWGSRPQLEEGRMSKQVCLTC